MSRRLKLSLAVLCAAYLAVFLCAMADNYVDGVKIVTTTLQRVLGMGNNAAGLSATNFANIQATTGTIGNVVCGGIRTNGMPTMGGGAPIVGRVPVRLGAWETLMLRGPQDAFGLAFTEDVTTNTWLFIRSNGGNPNLELYYLPYGNADNAVALCDFETDGDLRLYHGLEAAGTNIGARLSALWSATNTFAFAHEYPTTFPYWVACLAENQTIGEILGDTQVGSCGVDLISRYMTNPQSSYVTSYAGMAFGPTNSRYTPACVITAGWWLGLGYNSGFVTNLSATIRGKR